MIAAGVNAKALSTYRGHAGIQITLDLYGHLMPGNESEAARRSCGTWRRGCIEMPGRRIKIQPTFTGGS